MSPLRSLLWCLCLLLLSCSDRELTRSGGPCDASDECPEGETCQNHLCRSPADPCRVDSAEENDAPTLATVFPSDGGTLSDLVVCGNDRDWFAIEGVEAGAVLQVSALYHAAEGPLALALVSPNADVLARQEPTLFDDNHLSVVAPISGTYLVEVSGADNRGDTTYELAVSRFGGCADDASEPNGGPLEAVSLAADADLPLMLCKQDQDWFRLALGVGETLSVEVLFDARAGNLDAQLLDRDGFTVLSAGTSDFDNELLHHTAAFAGDYFVRVFPRATGVQNGYRLVTRVAADCPPDAHEPNGSFSIAAHLESSPALGHLCPGDEDWFELTLQAGERVVASLDFEDLQADMTLGLYATNGLTRLAYSDQHNDSELLTYEAPQAGNYFLRVGASRIVGAADYRVSTYLTPPCVNDPDDQRAANDNYLSASSTVPGTHDERVLCPGDVDVYAVTMGAGERLVASLAYPSRPQSGYIVAEILATNGVTPLATAYSTSEAITLSVNTPVPGDYFIRVSKSGALDERLLYDLTVARTMACTNDTFDLTSSNANFASASQLTAGEHADLVLCPGEQDWYEVSLTAGERLVVAASYVAKPSIGYTYLTIYGPDGISAVANTATWYQGMTLAYEAPTSGDYYVALVNWSNDPFPWRYELSLQVTASCDNDRFDDAGSNANYTNASSLAAGTHQGLVLCAGEQDWYEVSLSAGERLIATLNYASRPSAGYAYLYLYGPDGVSYLTYNASWNQNTTIAYDAQSSGNYYLYVVNWSNPPGAWNYELALRTVAACNNDSFDDAGSNANYTSASTISAGKHDELVLCPGEQDWYKVSLSGGERIIATLNYAAKPSYGAAYLYLYGPDGVTYLTYNASWNQNTTIAYDAQSSGDYYLYVVNWSNPAQAWEYDLVVSKVAACDNDAFDDAGSNANYTSASTLAAGAHGGLVLCPGEQDWYKVSLSGGERLIATLNYAAKPSYGAAYLYLYGPDGVSYLTYNASWNQNTTISYDAPLSGDYYLYVVNWSNPAQAWDYELVVSKVPACDNDALDDAGSNANYTSASALSAGAHADLVLCPGEQDWYKVSLAAGERLVATLNYAAKPSYGAAYLYLYGPDGVSYLTYNASWNQNTTIAYDAQSAGDYYLYVVNWSNPGQAWDYELVVSKAPACDNDVFDDASSNANYTSASGLGGGSYTGLVLCSGEQDWYKVSLAAGERLIATLNYGSKPSYGAAYLYLYGPDGVTYLTYNASWNQNTTIAYDAQSAGDYYLYVVNWSNPAQAWNYDLVVRKVPACDNDVFDDAGSNANYTSASGLAAGSHAGLVLCPGEQDWYKVSLAAGERIVATLNYGSRPSYGAAYLYLYGPDGVTYLTYNASWNQNTTIAYDAQNAGDYYLYVVNWSNPAQAWDYELVVNKLGACDNDVYDDAAPNANYTSATGIAVGTHPSLVLCSGEQDWYKVTLAEGQRLVATLNYGARPSVGYAYVYVYGTDGVSAVASAATVNQNTTVAYNAPAAGTYYVAVVNWSNPAQAWGYELVLSTTAACTPDSYDAGGASNDNYTTAASVTGSSTGTAYPNLGICPGDEDWFAVTLAGGQVLTAGISMAAVDPSFSNLDVYIFARDGITQLAGAASATALNESTSFTVPAGSGGTYYIRVVGANSVMANTYRLVVTVP